MKPITLKLNITLDEECLTALRDLIREATGSVKTDDELKKEARMKASRNALFAGQEPLEDRGLMIDMKAAARLLDVSEKTVWNMARDGRMPEPTRIGRAVRWPYEEIHAWETRDAHQPTSGNGPGNRLRANSVSRCFQRIPENERKPEVGSDFDQIWAELTNLPVYNTEHS